MLDISEQSLPNLELVSMIKLNFIFQFYLLAK